MIYKTKEEIINSIARVSICIETMIRNPDIPMMHAICATYTPDEIFRKQDKFDFQVYLLLVDLRTFSFLEDSFLDLLKDDELNFDSIKNRIFVNPADARRFSNKQVIRFIRNAVAHSDSDKELFKISPNGRFVEIDLKETKPIPFHVKLDYRDLLGIGHMIQMKSQYRYSSYVDSKNMQIKRIYVKDYMDPTVIFKKYAESKEDLYTYDDAYSELIKYFNENNIPHEIKTYNLHDSQKLFLKRWKKNCRQYIGIEAAKHYLDSFYFTVLSSILPLPQEKLKFLIHHCDIVDAMYKCPEYTFNQFSEEVIKGVHSTSPENLSYLAKAMFDKYGDNFENVCDFYYALNGYYLRNETIMQLITYYYSCCCDEETITIDGKTVEKENLRDALVHGRWFDDLDSNIVYFDTRTAKNNDYNFYMEEKLSLHGLKDYCMEPRNQKKS